jgi:drug/metabolite transporter (DMT)-like permease
MKNIDYFYLLLCVSGMSVGQLLFKKAALSMPVFSLPEILKNSWFLLAIGLYGITTLGWVWILRFIPLSLADPMMSLAFVLVPALGWLLLGEPLHWQTLVGGALILVGVTLAAQIPQ